MNRRLLISLLALIFLILGTFGAIFVARGLKPNLGKKTIEETGLLVATSNPDGAQLFLNNHLTTATNDTLTLPPQEYQVKIQKDGFLPWEKKLKIQKGVVTKTEAFLVPQAPDLRALTSTGALSPILSPDGTKLVYGVASASAQKQGVWILDLSERPPFLQSQIRQIAKNLAWGEFFWSPDSKQVLLHFEDSYYLLETDRLNENPRNVTATLTLIQKQWENEMKNQETERFSRLKPELQKIVSESFKIISFSLDETKILYQATASATLPPVIKPPLLWASSQKEEREIKPGKIYVYDLREDKNFYLLEAAKEEKKGPFSWSPLTLQWYPTSRHLIYVEKEKITLMEYDGTNRQIIYAGPFGDNSVYPTLSGSKIIILTTYNRPGGTSPNLYTINLR